MGEGVRRSLVDVWSESDIIEVADMDSEGAVIEALGRDIGPTVEGIGFRIAGVVEALQMADMFVLPAGAVGTDNERTGQTEMVRAGRIATSREGKIDGVSERSSSM